MDISDVLRRLRAVLGEQEVRRQWEALLLADAKTAKLIEFSLRQRLAEATGTTFEDTQILLEPIPKDKANGEIALGRVFFGDRALHHLGLRRDELIQHVAVFGRSGAGKTNVAFLLLSEVARLSVPFLVFDWKKNFRDLLAVPGFSKVVIHTVGREPAPLFFNPLVPPPHTDPKEWLKRLIDIACSAYFLGEGVAYVLQEEIDALYKEFHIYDSEKVERWPTFRDLHFRLKKRPAKGREAQWMESVLRAVGVLCFGAMDWVLNFGARHPIEKILTQQAVLELDALSQSDKRFLIETLLLWIHHYRMNEGGREQLKHVLMIEEAHHILLARAGGSGDESPMDVLVREVREFGEAIVFLDQLPSMISKPALENTFTTIAMNLKEQGDVTAAGRSMLLSSEQAKNLGRLPVGSAIVKLQSRWVKPFLVRFPLFEIKKGVVTDSQVQKRYEDSVDLTTWVKLWEDSMEALIRLVPQKWGPPPRPRPAVSPSKSVESPPRKLAEEEHRVLEDVRDHPLSKVTERYTRLGVTADKGTRLVALLLDRKLLQETVIHVDKAHVRLLELTPSGREALGLDETTTYRHGGVAHRFWVERIAGQLAVKGWEVEVESPVGGGKSVDVLVTAQGRRVAVEVETGSSDWQGNIEKTRGLVDLVVIACATKECAAEIESKVLPEDRSRVIVAMAEDAADTISKN